MTQLVKERLEIAGLAFRFLTPILLTIIGFFAIQYLSAIDKKFEKIETKFDTFIASYYDMDKRVDRLEIKVFDDSLSFPKKNGRR